MHRQRLAGHSLSVTGSEISDQRYLVGLADPASTPGMPPLDCRPRSAPWGFESVSRRSRPGYAAVRGYEPATTRAGR
jgi:hypothetical protein